MPGIERPGPRLGAALAAGVLLVGAGSAPSLEGFGGAAIPAGPLVAVTSTANAGPGTLREALAGPGPRRVVFRVAGTIALERRLEIRGRRGITVDGTSAPPPGITLRNYGVAVLASEDVLLRHLRVRGAAVDGIAIGNSRRVVVDHCSVSDSIDENISVTENARDVTVSWCLVADTVGGPERRSKGMLVANFREGPVSHVSIHHTLFVNEAQRSPQISTPGLFDIRNNVVVNWGAYGMRIRNGAFGNVVNNVFGGGRSPRRALVLKADAGPVHVAGNVAAADAGDVNEVSTAAAPWPVAAVATASAAAAAQAVLEGAGAWPRDAVDARLAADAAAALAAGRDGP